MSQHRFSHRHLIAEAQGDGIKPAEHPIDAIYVSTKGRSRLAEDLVAELDGFGLPIHLMISSIDDFPNISIAARSLDIHLVRPAKFELDSPLLSHRFSHDSCRRLEWDLHNKRNSAIALAKQNGYRKLLLVDDDIRGLTSNHLETAARLLDEYRVAGFYIGGIHDNSAISHICRSVGLPQSSFLSGACLAIDVDAVTSMFPPIYNEDWLFMFDAAAKGAAAVAGVVEQLPSNQNSYSQDAGFQEGGEILAEGAMAALPDGPMQVFSVDYWASYLASRRQLMATLLDQLKENDEESEDSRKAIWVAKAFLDSVLPIDCVNYFRAFAQQNSDWTDALSGFDPGLVVDSVSLRPSRTRNKQANDSIWRYPIGAIVTIVCPELPKKLRSPLAERTNRNYNRVSGLADLDAAIELMSEIKVRNPEIEVRIRSAAELAPDLIAEHLVFIGGVIWNSANAWMMQVLQLPVRQSTERADDVFIVEIDGINVEFAPVESDDDGVAADVGLFVRARNPFAPSRTVTICNGVLSSGVTGTARAFTHPAVASDNAKYVKAKQETYCVLLRVPVFNGDVIPPDLTQESNRLFEWSSDSSYVDVSEPTSFFAD